MMYYLIIPKDKKKDRMKKKSLIKSYKLFTVLFTFACILFITNNSTASATELSQQEKEELYQQYIEILEEVKATVTWGDDLVDIEVAPISSFTDEAWVSLEVFRQRAIERVQASFVEVPINEFGEDWVSEEVLKQRAINATQANAVAALPHSITPFSTDSAWRNLTVKHGSTRVNINVSAIFRTQLSDGRQRFIDYTNLRTISSRGEFTRTGVDARITNRGTTYEFTIGGRLDYLNLYSYHTLNTKFYCSPTGVVS